MPIVLQLPNDIPDYLKNARTFYGRNFGLCMIAEWDGQDWLFTRHDNEWVSQRKLTAEERKQVDDLFSLPPKLPN